MAKSKAKKAVKKGGGSRAAKETKEEQVEQTMSLLLGNMPPIKDVLYHLDTIKGLQDRVKTAQGKVTDAKKKAKEAGIDLKSIAEGMGMERMDGLDLATYLRQLQAIMREKGMPVQMSLYEPKYGSVEEMAKKEGWADGIAGRSPNADRWVEGAPGYPEYMRNWNSAQRQIIMDGSKKNASDEEEA